MKEAWLTKERGKVAYFASSNAASDYSAIAFGSLDRKDRRSCWSSGSTDSRHHGCCSMYDRVCCILRKVAAALRCERGEGLAEIQIVEHRLEVVGEQESRDRAKECEKERGRAHAKRSRSLMSPSWLSETDCSIA